MRRGRVAGAIVLCAFSLVLGFGPRMTGTFALLTARAANPNTVFAATALYAPGSLQASASGRNGALSWTAGQNGSGYKVLGLGNGTSNTCPASTSASYTAIGTATTLSYTDTIALQPSCPRARGTATRCRPATSRGAASIATPLWASRLGWLLPLSTTSTRTRRGWIRATS